MQKQNFNNFIQHQNQLKERREDKHNEQSLQSLQFNFLQNQNRLKNT
jgi:hypothetical protein